jgi:hypothetical protein
MSTLDNFPKLFEHLKSGLNSYQKNLHFTEIPNEDSNDEGVGSQLVKEYKRSTWYFQFSELLPSSNKGNSNTLSFKVRNNPHGLKSTDLTQYLPSIICREDYECRWTHNVGSNVIISGEFTFNDDCMQTIDYISNDHYGQTMIDSSKRDDRSLLLGNSLSLQSWASRLPSSSTSYKIPWFNSQSPDKYFPLYFCGMLDSINQVLTLRRTIDDLLIVRNKHTGEKVKADSKSLLSIGGNVVDNSSLTLPMPELWGKYIYLSDSELSFNRRQCSVEPVDTDNFNNGRNVIYVENIIKLGDNLNPTTLNGKTISIDIQNTEYPIQRILWLAQNQKALKEKYYSNYSTNSNDHNEGYSPILNTTININGKGNLIKNYPAFRTEYVDIIDQFPCVPREPGYNSFCPGIHAQNEDSPNPGYIINNGFIKVQLGDTNPYLEIDSSKSCCENEFMFYAYIVVLKRLTFYDFPANDNDRGRSSKLKISGN